MGQTLAEACSDGDNKKYAKFYLTREKTRHDTQRTSPIDSTDLIRQTIQQYNGGLIHSIPFKMGKEFGDVLEMQFCQIFVLKADKCIVHFVSFKMYTVMRQPATDLIFFLSSLLKRRYNKNEATILHI